MELVYLWVEDYKNIKKQGFNFSPRFRCDYNPDTNELTIDENDDYIENFFGDNINVTAIVGKNGSGKSSVSEMILTKVPREKHKKYILIGKTEEKWHSWGNIKELKLSGIDKITTLDLRIASSGVEIGAKDNRDFNHNLFYLNGKEVNFSMIDELKYSDDDNNIFVPKYIYQYNKNLNILKSKNFFYDFDKVRCSLRILKEDGIIQDIEKIDDLSKELKEKVISYISSLDSEKVFCYNFLITFVRYSLLNLSNKEYENFINSIVNINTNNCLETSQYHIDEIVKALNFLKKIKLEKEKTNLNQDTRYYYEVKIDDEEINSLWIFEYILSFDGHKKENLPILELDLYDSKKKLMYAELSQGEKQYIRLLIEVIANKGAGDLSESFDPKFYIFDEIETSLHPQWQKKIFNDIINIFNARRNKKAHLIFLTHSPFLLSDIPKQNIIFLDKDAEGKCIVVDGLKEKKQTFGANVHTLLSDSFFMEDGLMGEFAKGKINEIIDFHKKVEEENRKETPRFDGLQKEYETKKKHFWDIHSIIGEDYLKQVIKNHLVEIEKILLGKDGAKQEEIARVEKYLESLKNDKS